jgi:two-component system response regulator YesN
MSLSKLDYYTVETICSVIQSDLSKQYEINQLSKDYHINVEKLKIGFKLLTGKAVHEYINDLKMIEALKMVTTTKKKIIDIANRLGYESLSGFRKAFIKFHGHNPTYYR